MNTAIGQNKNALFRVRFLSPVLNITERCDDIGATMISLKLFYILYCCLLCHFIIRDSVAITLLKFAKPGSKADDREEATFGQTPQEEL